MKYRVRVQASLEIVFSRELTLEEVDSIANMQYPNRDPLIALADILVDAPDDLQDVSILSVTPVTP